MYFRVQRGGMGLRWQQRVGVLWALVLVCGLVSLSLRPSRPSPPPAPRVDPEAFRVQLAALAAAWRRIQYPAREPFVTIFSSVCLPV